MSNKNKIITTGLPEVVLKVRHELNLSQVKEN